MAYQYTETYSIKGLLNFIYQFAYDSGLQVSRGGDIPVVNGTPGDRVNIRVGSADINLIEMFTPQRYLTDIHGFIIGEYGGVDLTGLLVRGARKGSVSSSNSGIFDNGQWPLKTYAFSYRRPDFLAIIVTPDDINFRWLAIGYLNKSGDYAGGEWFGASHHFINSYAPVTRSITTTMASAGHDIVGSGWYDGIGVSPGVLLVDQSKQCCDCYVNGWGFKSSFWSAYRFDYTPVDNLKIQRNSDTWVGDQVVHGHITSRLYSHPAAHWSTHPGFVPYWLTKFSPVGSSPTPRTWLVGDIPYIRGIRLDRNDPKDIIQLGDEEWMVFPWTRKDLNPVNIYTRYYGDAQDPYYQYSGPFGWAIKLTDFRS